MDFNIKYVLIGLVLVILMVAFGNNPVENKRAEREAEAEGKDPLMESIRQYQEENPRSENGTLDQELQNQPGGMAPAPDADQAGIQPQPAAPQSGYYPPTGR